MNIYEYMHEFIYPAASFDQENLLANPLSKS